jgi:plastocyanin
MVRLKPLGRGLMVLPVLMLLGAAAPVRVSIRNLAYEPASVTIATGQTVVWTNNDDRDHQVRAENGAFESPNLSPGGSFSFTFKTAGTYAYGCPLHPRERGVIRVE